MHTSSSQSNLLLDAVDQQVPGSRTSVGNRGGRCRGALAIVACTKLLHCFVAPCSYNHPRLAMLDDLHTSSDACLPGSSYVRTLGIDLLMILCGSRHYFLERTWRGPHIGKRSIQY